VDSKLTEALAHPLRAEVFALLVAEPGSAQQIAKRLAYKVECVAYHIGVLDDLGYLQPAGIRPTQKGGIEEFYEAAPIAVAEYLLQKLPPLEPESSSSPAILRRIFVESIAALEAGTIDMSDSRLGCFTATFDQEGFKKVSMILGETVAAVVQTYRESKARLERGRSEPMHATIISGWFESPTEKDMLGDEAI
jgi:hypothetical protein